MLKTINLTADTVTPVKLYKDFTADILNCTDGNLFVSYSNDFVNNDGIGDYATIPPCCALNSLKSVNSDNRIYLKAEIAGKVSIFKR